MEFLENFCFENLYRVEGDDGEIDYYDPFPKFEYCGVETNDPKNTIDRVLVFILSDRLVIEGITVSFINCNREQIESMLKKIITMARNAIDFIFVIDEGKIWNIISADKSGVSH